MQRFASPTALRGLSRLAVWWLRLGIRIERIKPGHPAQNGRHERMHLTLKQEATKPAAANMLQQQRMRCYRTAPSIAEVSVPLTLSRSTCSHRGTKLEIGGVPSAAAALGCLGGVDGTRTRGLRRDRPAF